MRAGPLRARFPITSCKKKDPLLKTKRQGLRDQLVTVPSKSLLFFYFFSALSLDHDHDLVYGLDRFRRDTRREVESGFYGHCGCKDSKRFELKELIVLSL